MEGGEPSYNGVGSRSARDGPPWGDLWVSCDAPQLIECSEAKRENIQTSIAAFPDRNSFADCKQRVKPHIQYAAIHDLADLSSRARVGERTSGFLAHSSR